MKRRELDGYNPTVTVYKYPDKSRFPFWMNYVLPNGERARRPSDKTKAGAERKARIKQGQLFNGMFDEYDRERLDNYFRDEQRLTLDEAKNLYLETTINNKTRRTLKRDRYLLGVAFDFFKSRGAVLLDDISPLLCVRLIASLKKKGLKRSSIKNYWSVVSKVFNKLRKLRLIKLENPMQDVDLPREGKMERTRIPSVDEIHSILSHLATHAPYSVSVSPVNEIIRFTIFTGARIGEVLHAEWEDFEDGYWFIRNKEKCPGVEGLGWSPKWGKERTIKLFPEAVNILESIPKRDTVGYVSDDGGTSIAFPANFVFPKVRVKIIENCPMMVAKGYRRCFKCGKFDDLSTCRHRIVTYSRCDSIKKVWKTVCRNSDVEDLHVHDLRRFFNRVILQEKLGFSPEESGRYIGNSEEVNREHYSPISNEIFEKKINHQSFFDLVPDAGP
jgi:integrase